MKKFNKIYTNIINYINNSPIFVLVVISVLFYISVTREVDDARHEYNPKIRTQLLKVIDDPSDSRYEKVFL